MHRIEDIEIINSNIDKLSNKAMLIYKTSYEPTLSESTSIYNELLNFIIKKKRIVYGGYAQNELILMKNSNDGFYKDVDTPDIEFYSFEPIKDLIELCDYLKSKKFKYVQGSEGLHEGTYKIFVNFVNYCDITYLPKNIYDNCKYIENKKMLRLADPYFMLIDIYRVFTDPMTSYWRLDKTFKRYLRVYKYYPLTLTNTNIFFGSLSNENILQVIRKEIIHNSNYIVVGSYAYNYYIKKVNNDTIKINFYEIITENINIEAQKIYIKLKKIYNDKITIKEYYPYFDYFDYRVEFLYENCVILRVYNNNNRCIVFNESITKKTKFGTTQIILLYLLSNYNYYITNRNILESNNYISMFLKLSKAKNIYLDKKNITVLNNSPFQEFKFNCIGKPVSLERLDRLNMIKKRIENKPLKFRYEPKNDIGNAPAYVFDNLSGNQVLNQKYFIIKI